MIGGMITAPLPSLFVLPAIYKLMGWRRLAMAAHEQPEAAPDVAMTPVTSA